MRPDDGGARLFVRYAVEPALSPDGRTIACAGSMLRDNQELSILRGPR